MRERRAKFGPYVYTADLGVLRLAPDCAFTRWASVHEITGTSHLVYHLLAPARDKFTIRRFLRAAEAAIGGCGPHALGIASFALLPFGTACLVTPYPGDLGGVTTLRQLVRAKGGRLAASEVARAAEHLIDALECGEHVGKLHGAFDLDGCVVDRGGRVAIELFGFPPKWARSSDDGEALRREQRRSLGRVVRDLVRGDAAAGDKLASAHAAPELWESWLQEIETSTKNADWNMLKSKMPRARGHASREPSVSVVHSLWDKFKQIASGVGGGSSAKSD